MNEIENAWKEYYDYRDIPDEVERKLKELYSKAVKLEKNEGIHNL